MKDDRNLHGPGSIAVPGVVAGMEEAYRRHARLPWKELVASERRARRRRSAGGLVDHADDRELGRRPAALSGERRRLSAGWPAAERAMGHQVRACGCRRTSSRRRWRSSPRSGPRDFYQGDLARSIAADIQAAGGALSVEDLASFRAHLREPLAIPYRGGKVFATPELTAGPTMAHTLRLLQQNLQPARGGPDAAAYAAYAPALQSAYRERLQDMGDADGRRALGAEASGAGLHHAFLRGRSRRQHGGGDADAVVDLRLQIRDAENRHHHEQRHHVVRSDAGRRRIRWRPGKRCLTNYTPVVAQAADGRRLAAGASGGRRILPAVTQLLSFVMDFGMDLDAAIHQPRIDASEGAIVIGDVRLPAETRQALRARFDYEEARMQTLPMKFACPSVVLRDGETNSGAAEPFQPWGDAVAEN